MNTPTIDKMIKFCHQDSRKRVALDAAKAHQQSWLKSAICATGNWIKTNYYRKLLRSEVLLGAQQHFGCNQWIFPRGSAPAHRAGVSSQFFWPHHLSRMAPYSSTLLSGLFLSLVLSLQLLPNKIWEEVLRPMGQSCKRVRQALCQSKRWPLQISFAAVNWALVCVGLDWCFLLSVKSRPFRPRELVPQTIKIL